MEEWKDIPLYEEHYQVSNMGNIRKKWCIGYNKRNYPKQIKQRIRGGYRVFYIHKDGKETTGSVHRAIAQAFIPNPENKRTVNHKDGNKLNNSLDNLEWSTDSENCKHRFTHLGHKVCYGGNIGKPVIKYNKDMEIIEEYTSIRQASIKSSILPKNIKRCCIGEQHTAGGYVWRYK